MNNVYQSSNSPFNIGDILVVPSPGRSAGPMFFKVVTKAAGNGMFLRLLGSKLSESGKSGYVPSSMEYHDSYSCPSRKSSRLGGGAIDYVPVWCGDAYKWDGTPC